MTIPVAHIAALLLAVAPPAAKVAKAPQAKQAVPKTAAILRKPGLQNQPFHTQATVHTIRIELTADAWQQMQPKPKGFMQNDFPEQPAKLTVDGKPYTVSIRFKGNGTYMMSGSLIKRPFKIDIDKIVKEQNINGITTLNLGNNVMDQTGLREVLAYELFTQLGVPCSKTTFADVTLQIPGIADNLAVGLYSIPEQLDARFFARHYPKPVTFVLKPENANGLPKFDTWKQYETVYEPKGKPSDDDKKRFMDFISFLHNSKDDEFAAKLGDYLDIENFARFLAGTVVTSAMDSILAMGHNYYIIRDPVSGKFQFLPWDLDLAFGAFPMAGANGIRLSVTKPYTEREVLLKRFLAVPMARARYEVACRNASAIMRKLEPLRTSLGRTIAPVIAKNDMSTVPGAPNFGMFGGPAPAQDSVKPVVAANTKSVFVLRNGQQHQFAANGLKPIASAKLPAQQQNPMPNMFGDGVTLTEFFTQRADHIAGQLAGKLTGEQPRGMMGGPGGPGGFDLSNLVAGNATNLLGLTGDTFEPTEWSKKWADLFATIDTGKDNQLSKAEWDTATLKPNDLMANIFPGQIWAALGGKTVAQASFTKITTGWFETFDASHDGKLTRKELGDGFLAALPPPDFGRPGGFPGVPGQ
jgi:hypothetical protein